MNKKKYLKNLLYIKQEKPNYILLLAAQKIKENKSSKITTNFYLNKLFNQPLPSNLFILFFKEIKEINKLDSFLIKYQNNFFFKQQIPLLENNIHKVYSVLSFYKKFIKLLKVSSYK